MKRTLFRYLLMEVLGPFLIGLVIFTFVLLMFQILKLTELIVSYGVGLGDVGRLLMYILPPFFVFTVPMSFLLAVLMAISRMSSDSEITALKAGGISLWQLYPPVLALSLVASLACAFLALVGDPWGKQGFRNMLLEMGREKATIGVVEHVFNDSFKDMTLYVHHVVPEQDLLEGIFLADERAAGEPLVVTARQGKLGQSPREATLAMDLYDGAIHRVDPQDKTIYETVRFKQYRLEVDLAEAMGKDQLKRTYLEMTMPELRTHIAELRAKDDDYAMRRAWVEYHRRFAFPFACVVFGLIALPLGVSPPRSGRSRGFSTSIIVLCAFYLLFRAGENLGWKGVLHPIVAMWTPLAVGVALGLYLLKKKSDESPIWLLDMAQYGAQRATNWLRAKLGLDGEERS
ncbi:MAG TPA: LPS export ABC transporter permease LptF [bacterium]|nr:LPS export ABC transporter permease LptF [bacterium]